MKPAPLALAFTVVAACAAPGAARREAARPRQDLVAVSRAMTIVDAAARKGTLPAQRQKWSAAAAADPRSATARFLATYAQGADMDGFAAMHQLARDLPDSALPWIGLASIYVRWNVLDQVDRTTAAALELEPDDWLAVLVRAEADARRARWDAAGKGFQAVLAADPENPDAHAGLAEVLRAAGDAAGARAQAEAALKVAPDHLGALRLLAELADASGDRSRAIDLWAAAADADPSSRDLRVRLAKAYGAAGDPGGALGAWQSVVAMREDADALVALAAAARDAHDPKAEGQALERLSRIDPSAGEWRRIAEIRLAGGDQDGAAHALERALARDPKDAGANLQLGRLRAMRGESQAAVEALRAAGDAGKDDLRALQAKLNVEPLQARDAASLQRTVGGLIERTYRRRLADAPALSGTLRLRATVDAAGVATGVEVLEDSVHDEDVRACAYWNLRDAAYPKDRPGRYAFAFTLRPPRR